MKPMDRRLTPRRFDADTQLVARRAMLVDGKELNRGDPIPMSIPANTRMRLWMSARAVYEKDFRPTPQVGDAENPGPEVTITHEGGPWYVVKASWLEEGERIKGKAAAEARKEELEAEGPPEAKQEPEQPDWSAFPEAPHEFSDEQKDQFKTWYLGLEASDEPTIEHAGVKVAFDLAREDKDPFAAPQEGEGGDSNQE